MDFEEIFEDGQEGDQEEGGFQNNADMFMFGMNSQEIEELRENRDAVVFLIDCHKLMHEKNPHNEDGNPSNLELVIKAAHSFMKTKIITSDNDKIGIVLYGS